MKNLYALPAAALAVILAIATLSQATQAQTRSAGTADRSMSVSKPPACVVASMGDHTAPSLLDSRSKAGEVASPRPVSASPQPYDLNWLQGGGG